MIWAINWSVLFHIIIENIILLGLEQTTKTQQGYTMRE